MDRTCPPPFAALERQLSDPETLVTSHLFFRLWGRTHPAVDATGGGKADMDQPLLTKLDL